MAIKKIPELDKVTSVSSSDLFITSTADGTKSITYENLTKDIKTQEMKGSTTSSDGESGSVPIPKKGQNNYVLRGNGTWTEEQDLSKYYNNASYNKDTNKLQLKHDDTVLKEIEISGGGGTKISPKPTVSPSITNGNSKVTVKWGDPDDVVIDEITLSTWAGTKLVMKESGYPENGNDGTLILNNTTRDKYKTSGYQVTGLTNGKTYYFALFPYSTDNIYNYQTSNRLLGKPSLVKLNACTNINATTAMGSATITWSDPDETKTVDGVTATWAKTILIYKEGATAPSSISDGTIAVTETTRNQYSSNGYKVSNLTDGKQYTFALFAVSTENVSSDSISTNVKLWANLTISTDETTLYSKNVTATYGSNSVNGTFSSSGTVALQIPWIGETTLTATDDTDTATSKVTISSYGSDYSAELSFLKIVTFANGTDEEIVAMIEAHYNNKINIADYWAAGDKRNVSLSAMSATGVGESHRAQTVQYAIADFEHDTLSTPINGHTKAAVTLTQVDCLMDATNASNLNNGSNDTEKGYMNSSGTNNGGWKSCARRIWCNNVYYDALPSVIKSSVKSVNKLTSVGSSSYSINTTSDKIFLLSEIEIFGSKHYSYSDEGTQYTYYKTQSNRYKMPKWNSSSVSNIWWERSPRSGSSGSFCCVYYGGYASDYYAGDSLGLAPCLCI